MLEKYIRTRRRSRDILLMAHIVIGYPSFDKSFEIVKNMVEAGVDLMELQIPFSEPIADGPVILKANQKALENGSSVSRCLEFAEDVSRRFDIPFLFMTYANIGFRFGWGNFADRMSDIGLYGAIIPDLPPEEGKGYISAMTRNNLDPIFIFTPETCDERMSYLADHASGFVYCTARKGVTGRQTSFSDELGTYLERCSRATCLPLAVGFGVRDRKDINFLKGRADIAVIGSQTIRIVQEHGPEAAGEFISSLL